MVLKFYHITWSLHGWSIHQTNILLQENRFKPFLGTICIISEVLDMSKETINQGDKSLFWYLLMIKVPVKILWYESLLSNPTETFNRKFYLCWYYFLFYFKVRFNTTTTSIKLSFHFIVFWDFCSYLLLNHLGSKNIDMDVFLINLLILYYFIHYLYLER